MFSEVFLVNIVRVQIFEVFLTFHILGLTGRNAAGKGAVAEILKQKSFIYHSLSDILRKELRNKGKKESRENLIQVGNNLRKSGGPSILADLMIKNLVSLNHHVVDSIRNPAEVDSLNRTYLNHKFNLIAVDALPEIRFKRLKERNRIGDSSSWEEFVHQESLEEKSDNPNKQQLFGTILKADYNVDNSGTLTELNQQINKIINQL